MATITTTATLSFHSQNPIKTLPSFSLSNIPFSISKTNFTSFTNLSLSIPASKSNNASSPLNRYSRFSCNCISTATPNTNYECGLGGNRTSVERETKCAVLRVDWTGIRVRLLINQVAKLFLENKGIFLISIFLSNLLILCMLFNHRGWLTSYFKCVNAMQFSDSSSEVELRLSLVGLDIQSSRDIFVDADGTSLVVQVQHSGSHITLIETNKMFEKIKPAETIWFIDDDQLVINMKKQDPDLKWPDIVESWESLTAGSMQLLKGASIFLVGDSTEINQKVARELAVGLGYTLLDTQELLETFAKQTIDSWVLAEGSDSVAEAECAILESLSSHVRAVVSTLGGKQGAAGKAYKWQHLYAGFTVWLSQTEALDEDSAKEEARQNVKDRSVAYSNADVVVKLQGWDSDHAKSVAQASLSALKQLILSDKKLPGKKSLYIRLGCRGDWPNIKPPGWDPSNEAESIS